MHREPAWILGLSLQLGQTVNVQISLFRLSVQGLKICCQQWRAGSSPATGTMSSQVIDRLRRFFYVKPKADRPSTIVDRRIELERDLTTGKIGKSMLAFSMPMILGNMLQQLYNVADTLIVGKTVGATALSAVGSAYALMVLLTSIIMGLCMGSGVVFAQMYGARQHDAMKTGIYNAFVFILLVSLLINVLSMILLDQLIDWLHVPEVSVTYTKQYLQIVLSGMTFVSIYNFFTSVLRSIGNTMVPLFILVAASITNIVLDLVFILYFGMEVAGAAAATLISQILSAVIVTAYFFKKARNICPQKSHMHFSRSLLWRIVHNSTLTAVQQSIMNFGILMVQGLVNSFGFAASAAFAAGVKIDAFAYMPAQDFGNAFSTFIAQNHGAGKRDRIRKGTSAAVKISLLFCVCASICVFVLAEPLMLLFVKPEETQIIDIGVQYLRIEGACYIGIGLLFLLYGFYRGIEKSGMSIVLTVISLGSRVALAYTLSAVSSIGMLGIWWSVPIGWVLADCVGLGYLFVRRSHWFSPSSHLQQ